MSAGVWLLPFLVAAAAITEAVAFDRPVQLEAVTVTAPPARGTQVQVRPIPPPPTTTTTTTVPSAPVPVPGDCGSWRAVFAYHGATTAELAFFFDRGVIWRETRCGLDVLNEATGDSGICQINPVHNRAGYFDGVRYGAGGWLFNLFGMWTRQNLSSGLWARPCLHLYRVEGTDPWSATR